MSGVALWFVGINNVGQALKPILMVNEYHLMTDREIFLRKQTATDYIDL
jgi:hypothetical protein